MNFKIIKNRKLVEDENFVGYNEENRAEMLQFEIPENLQEYSKKICFETDDGNFFDLLEDNKYIVKNNLTKFDKIRFYLEFTKELEQDKIELIKTEVKTLEFKDSFDVDKEIDEEEIEILDRLIVQINSAIQEANNLDLDVEKVDTTVTITVTKKDGTTKTATVKDGIGLDYDWNNTSLGIKRENEEEYEYVELKGEKGDCNFATFDIEDGDLIMNKDDDMNIDFVINQGNLEVIING